MKRALSIIVGFLCLFTVGMQKVSAQQVSESQAREKAMAFLNGTSQNKSSMRKAPRRPPNLQLANNCEEFFIYNDESNGGYVIISGDERAETVLGYSDEGTYDENNIPDNFRWWMEGMASEIAALQQDTEAESNTSMGKVKRHAAIAPLIKTKWGQNSPYNSMCPEIDGQHCATGCVATTGAQIMYYYRWPKTETKTVPGYRVGVDVDTSKDLDPITFKWDEMKTSYTSADQGTASATAVAELMLYCGYATRMVYGLRESGGGNDGLVGTMGDCFDYDSNSWESVSRRGMSVADWDSLIYNELANARPVIYSGRGKYGSHSFICDGYDGEGYYHFNWGWNGSSDGYFKFQAANPYGDHEGFCYAQGAIIGVQPNRGNNDNSIVLEVLQLDAVGTTVYCGFGSLHPDTLGFSYGMGELNSDGSLTVLDTRTDHEMKPTGFLVGMYDVSSYNLSEGTHQIVPICLQDGETEWKRCHPASVWFEATVHADGTIELVLHPILKPMATDLKATNFDIPGPHFAIERQQEVKVTVESYNGDFTETLYLFASKTDDMGKAVYIAGTAIEENSSEVVSFYFIPNEVGTWNLWVSTDSEGKNIIGQTTVEFVDAPTGTAKLKASNIVLKIGTTTTLSATITNTGDVTYYRELSYSFQKNDGTGSYAGSSLFTDPLELAPKESISHVFSFNDLDEGEDYWFVCFYYPKFSDSYSTYMLISKGPFTIPISSGVKEIVTENEDAPWYTVDGIRLDGKPQKRGVYIHRGKKVVNH